MEGGGVLLLKNKSDTINTKNLQKVTLINEYIRRTPKIKNPNYEKQVRRKQLKFGRNTILTTKVWT